MKKLLNDPQLYVEQMLEGLVLAHPQYYERTGADGRVIKRPGSPKAGKVGIVSGGGSGHLPIFTGYVGKGLLDACAIGEVFASPSVEQMAAAMRAANGGAGVLRLYGNYGGDRMNFDMAGDMLEMEDMRSTTVLADRRCRQRAGGGTAEAPWRGRHGVCLQDGGRRGGSGRDLDEVTRIAPEGGRRRPHHRRGADAVHRAAGRPPTFTIADDEMEMGMGIHGEPGVWRGKLRPADAIAGEMLDHLLADTAAGARPSRLGAGQQPGRDTAGGVVHFVSRRGGAAGGGGGRDHRHAAGRALCHLDGDGRRVDHSVQAGRGTGKAAARAGRVRILAGVTWR